MKRILHYLAFIIVLLCLSAQAETVSDNFVQEADIERVEIFMPENSENEADVVEEFGNDAPQPVTLSDENEVKSLRDKSKDVYNIEVEKYDRPDYLFKEILTHNCKKSSVMENWHIWGAYNAYSDMNFGSDSTFSDKYVSNALNVGFDGFLKNNNSDFRIMMGFPIDYSGNYTQALFSDVYIATNKIPHHRIQIGHFRPQVGMNGGSSAYTIPFLRRSQIGRTFGTARRLGGRIKGDYSYLDYDFGVYSSGTYFTDFFPGTEFVGCMNFKPLAKVEDKYGKLKLGGGIDGGKRDNDFFVTGAYVGYEYKRFMAEFEWANANGYNGAAGHSRKHATGFYTTIGYMLTKKLQLVACYDQFDPDKNIDNNNKREMTLGLNYFIKGQALRLILNYVFCQNDNTKDSHRIMLGAQILI